VPLYILATREDHIAPWKSAYAGVHLYGGPVRFVLGGSGHIAGITNSPETAKYPFWTNTRNPETPEQWLETATEREGSWWIDWDKWQARRAGPKVPARKPGAGKLKALCPAPGTYVLQKDD
jgi:polyhydroxyalkanoate synthase